MNRGVKKTIFAVLLLVMLVVVFTACVNKTSENVDDKEDEVVLESIQIDRSTIPAVLYAGNVHLEEIKLILNYSDGTTGTEDMKMDYIAVASRNKLDQIGTHQLEVFYKDCKASFQLELLDPNVATYTLVVEGGVPISVNGEDVSLSPNDEGIFTGVYGGGSVVVISWLAENNKVFNRWIADGSVIDNQSTTTVYMNANHVYRAEANDVIYTVGFITNKENHNIAAKTVKRLYDYQASFDKNNIYYDSAPEISMDDYVFAGWTLQEITLDQALSGAGNYPLIDFSSLDENGAAYFAVESNVMLYAVWTPMRLDFIDYTPSISGYSQTAGKKTNKYDGTITNLVIPETHDGMPVLAISKDTFTGENAAFIETITIPSGVLEIEEGTFRYCSSLKAIYVASGSTVYSGENGVLYRDERATLVAYPANRVQRLYEMESTVSAISAYAFYNAVVGKVVFSPDVASLGDHSFDSVHIDTLDFSSVAASKFSSAKSFIGSGVFNDNLSSIILNNIDGDREIFRTLSGFSDFSDRFSTGTDVHSLYTYQYSSDVTILFRLISSSDLAVYFENRSSTAEIVGISRNVSEIVIPDRLFTGINSYAVSSIGYYAFKDCLSLAEVTLPSGLERVSDLAFDDTPWAQKLNGDSIIANETLYKYLGNEETFNLPADVKKIAESAFRNNKTLKFFNLTSNTSLEKICAMAFMNCENLLSFSDTNDDGKMYVKSNVRSIGAYAFYNTSIRYIESESSSSLMTIGEYSFAACKYLLDAAFTSDILSSIDVTSFFDTESLLSFEMSEANDLFASYDGCLYQLTGKNTASLFAYPSGKMTAVFAPAAFVKKYLPVTDGTFRVFEQLYTVDTAESTDSTIVGKYTVDDNGTERTYSFNLTKEGDRFYFAVVVNSIGENALYNSNIGALYLDSSITGSDIVRVPGLVYLAVEALSSINYHSLFPEEKYEPDYVWFTTLAKDNVSGFFNSDQDLCNAKYCSAEPVDFFDYSFDCVQKLTTNEESLSIDSLCYLAEGNVYLARTPRNVISVIVPETISYGGNDYTTKTIGSFSFGGWFLSSIAFEKGIDEIAHFALELTHILRFVSLNETETTAIPMVYGNSFGPTFNDGLLLYINSGMAEYYIEKWNTNNSENILETFTYSKNGDETIACPYLIENRLAFAVLTYRDDNGEVVTVGSPIIGSIKPEDIRNFYNNPAVQKDGYVVGGWTNEKNETVDISNIYSIPYNQVLSCVWEPRNYVVYLYINDVYQPTFDAEKTEENNTYEVSVVYRSSYEWDLTGYDMKYKTLKGWTCRLSDGEHSVMSKGYWSLSLDRETDEGTRVTFYAQLEDRKYRLIYKCDDVDLSNTQKDILYDASYSLSIPTRQGYTFKGWQCYLSENESVQLTYANGESISNWSFTFSLNDEYEIYPIWEANDILVSLYLSSGELYKNVTVKYDSIDYVFQPEEGLFTEQQYTRFSGWADLAGTIYTDSEGAAIRVWDKTEQTDLYAVWPIEVGTVSDLMNVLNTSMSASVVLTADLEITDVTIGTLELPYEGVFNGDGHTIRYSVTTTTAGYCGLFAKNGGAIKNLNFEVVEYIANISTRDFGGDKAVYYGTLCAINDGFITNVNVSVSNMTVTVDDKKYCYFDKSGSYYVGVVCAQNNGKISGSCTYYYKEDTVYFKNSTELAQSYYDNLEWSRNYSSFYTYINNDFVAIGAPYREDIDYYVFDSVNSDYVLATENAHGDHEGGKWELNYSKYFTKNNDVYTPVSVPFSENTVYYMKTEDIMKNQRVFNVGTGENTMSFMLQQAN